VRIHLRNVGRPLKQIQAKSLKNSHICLKNHPLDLFNSQNDS
jgi:hypothetical protein